MNGLAVVKNLDTENVEGSILHKIFNSYPSAEKLEWGNFQCLQSMSCSILPPPTTRLSDTLPS